MIKSQLVKRLLNKNPHLIQRDVENITSIVLEKITSTLENEGRVEIRGFGSLSVRRRQSKNGRNPRTGESVFVPEKKAPVFKSGSINENSLRPAITFFLIWIWTFKGSKIFSSSNKVWLHSNFPFEVKVPEDWSKFNVLLSDISVHFTST